MFLMTPSGYTVTKMENHVIIKSSGSKRTTTMASGSNALNGEDLFEGNVGHQ